MKLNVAFFDVDGTVIAQDSFMILVWTSLKRHPWRVVFFILFCPVFVFTAVFQTEKRVAKSCALWSLTIGLSRRAAIHYLRHAVLDKLSSFWFQEAHAELAKLRAQGVSICYVSASGQVWLRSLLNKNDPGSKCIVGSRLGFFAGGVVMKSPNCYGKEKLNRIAEAFKFLKDGFNWHSGYSDHRADIPMLTNCGLRYVVCPTIKNRTAFQKVFQKNFLELQWHWSASSVSLKNQAE